MAPEDIRSCLSREYPELVVKARTNPDGWSFFLGPPKRGANSNRILRAVRQEGDGATWLKLPVSSRHELVEREIDFSGDEEMLRALVDRELELYRTHFDKR